MKSRKLPTFDEIKRQYLGKWNDGTIQETRKPQILINPTPAQKELAELFGDTIAEPNGKFIMADFHPIVWMFDNDFKEVFYNYFNVEPILEEESGTYADKEAALQTTTITWNHPISEVLNALISNGLEINCFNEFDYSPYNCFNQTEEFEPNKFRIKHLENKIPMVYSLSATKK